MCLPITVHRTPRERLVKFLGSFRARCDPQLYGDACCEDQPKSGNLKNPSTLWIAPGSVEPRLSESLPTPRSSRCFATACSLRKNAHDLLLCLAGVRAPSAGPLQAPPTQCRCDAIAFVAARGAASEECCDSRWPGRSAASRPRGVRVEGDGSVAACSRRECCIRLLAATCPCQP